MRYSRQILIPGIGLEGQQKIAASRLVVVGCGALGTVSSELLVRAGVGRIRVVDRDFVEESNLQRQSLFTEEDVLSGMPKAVAAQRALRAVNSQVAVEGVVDDLTAGNIARLCREADLILDGSDNFETRFLINDFAVSEGVPWIYGACLSTYGIAAPFEPGRGCLQCLLPDSPQPGSLETCETAGIWGPVVHVVAAYQAGCALKILIGAPRPKRPEILQFDLWENRWRVMQAGDPGGPPCRCCAGREFRFLSGEEGGRLTRLCGRNAVQVTPKLRFRPDFEALCRRLSGSAVISFNDHLLRIRLPEFEINLFADGRSIIKGTDDPAQARALYARYIGA